MLASVISALSAVAPFDLTTTASIRGGVSITKSTGRFLLPSSNAGSTGLSIALFCDDKNMADPTRKTQGDVLALDPASVNMWNGTWTIAPPATISSDTGYLIYGMAASMGSGSLVNGTVGYTFAGSARAKPHFMELGFAVVAGEAILEAEYYTRDAPIEMKVALLGDQVVYSIIFAKANTTAA